MDETIILHLLIKHQITIVRLIPCPRALYCPRMLSESVGKKTVPLLVSNALESVLLFFYWGGGSKDVTPKLQHQKPGLYFMPHEVVISVRNGRADAMRGHVCREKTWAPENDSVCFYPSLEQIQNAYI